MSTALQTTLDSHLRPLRLFWLMEVATLVVLGGVFLVATPTSIEGAEQYGTIFIPIALLQAAILFFLRVRTMGSLALRSPDDLRAEQTVEGRALQDAVEKAAQRYWGGTVVGLALAESIGLLGFVYAWVTASLTNYLGFGLFALVLVSIQIPTRTGMTAVLTGPERKGLRRALHEE